MNFSVGDFAEQLIAEERAQKTEVLPPSFEPDTSVYSSHVEEQAPDISQVEVPNDFVTSIVENKVSAIPEPFIQTEEPIVQPISEVAELKSLMMEVKDLLLEVKQTLSEMTTVGMMGVGASAPNVKRKNDEKEDDLKKLLRRIKAGQKAK